MTAAELGSFYLYHRVGEGVDVEGKGLEFSIVIGSINHIDGGIEADLRVDGLPGQENLTLTSIGDGTRIIEDFYLTAFRRWQSGQRNGIRKNYVGILYKKSEEYNIKIRKN